MSAPRPCRLLVLASLLPLLLAACDDSAPGPDEGDQHSAAVEATEERAAEAQELFAEAQAASVDAKPKLFRRLIARYPESEFVPQAFLQLVFWLGDLGRYEDAVEGVHQFGARFPRHPSVAAAASATHGTLTSPRAAAGASRESLEPLIDRLLESWGDWLETALAQRDELEASERADLLLSAGRREMILSARVPALEVAATLGRAARHLEEAAQIELPENRRLTMQATLLLGQVRQKLGERERALATYRALRGLRERHGVGPSLEEIDALIAEVDTR